MSSVGTLVRSVGFGTLLKLAFLLFFVGCLMFAGVAIAVLPFSLVVALLALPIIMIATVYFPLFSVVIALFVTFGAIPSGFLPQVPFAGGTVKASELFFAGIGGVFLMHAISTKGRFLQALRSDYTTVFVLLLFLVFISSIVSLGFSSTPLKYYLYELRVCLYWFVFPLLLYAVRNERDLSRLLVSLSCVGAVIAVGVIVQFSTGIVVLEAGKVEALNISGSSYLDVRRSFAGGGIYFVLLCLNLSLCLWVYKKQKIVLAGAIVGVTTFAVLVTFGRGVWVAECLAFLLIFILVPSVARIKLLISSFVAVGLLISALAIFSPNTLQAVVDRATSFERELESGESYDWRRVENQYAIAKIASNPLVGVGLGGVYQPHRHRLMSPEHVRVIHNGYLYLVLKFGVAGLLVPILFSIFTIKNFILMRRKGFVNDYAEPILIGLISTLFVPYLTSITQPEWMYHTGVAFFSSVFVCVVLIDRYWVKQSFAVVQVTKS